MFVDSSIDRSGVLWIYLNVIHSGSLRLLGLFFFTKTTPLQGFVAFYRIYLHIWFLPTLFNGHTVKYDNKEVKINLFFYNEPIGVNESIKGYFTKDFNKMFD